MISFIAAGLMWVLVLILCLRARSRPDNTLLWAATIIAASMTTNISEFYLWAASWGPWPNALDLAANVLLILGIYHLASAIRRGAAAAGAVQVREKRRSRGGVVLTIAAMIVAFSLIEDPVASTTFMLTYGSQPAAAVYSMVQYLYIFAVMLGTLISCVRNLPVMTQRRFQVGFTVTGVGCAVAMALCVSVVAMDISHVVGALQLMTNLGTIYDYLFVAALLLLCAGLGIPPLTRQVQGRMVRKRVFTIEPAIQRIWTKTAAKNPSVSLVGSVQPKKSLPLQENPRTVDRMHRMLVEIHDYLNVEPAAAARISAREWHQLEAAEELCLQRTGAS